MREEWWVQVLIFSFLGSACGGQSQNLRFCRQPPSLELTCRQARHISADVSESKGGFGGEPPGVERKGGQTQLQGDLSFPDRGQSGLLTQRQCTVTSPLLRPHYLVESATVEEEQPQGTMKYLVEGLRQQEVARKFLKGTASNYWRIRKN